MKQFWQFINRPIPENNLLSRIVGWILWVCGIVIAIAFVAAILLIRIGSLIHFK
jgi:hypothetical protein